MAKPKVLSDMLRRLLVQDDHHRLYKILERLIEKAQEGDMTAIKEVADRLEGRPAQQNILSGDASAPALIKVITGIDSDDDSKHLEHVVSTQSIKEETDDGNN